MMQMKEMPVYLRMSKVLDLNKYMNACNIVRPKTMMRRTTRGKKKYRDSLKRALDGA